MPTSMPDNLSQTLDNLIGPKFLGTESFLTLCPNTKVVRHWCRHPKFHVLTFLITFWQDFSWFCPKKSGTLLVIFFATKKNSWLLTAMLLEPIDPSGSGYPLPLAVDIHCHSDLWRERIKPTASCRYLPIEHFPVVIQCRIWQIFQVLILCDPLNRTHKLRRIHGIPKIRIWEVLIARRVAVDIHCHSQISGDSQKAH